MGEHCPVEFFQRGPSHALRVQVVSCRDVQAGLDRCADGEGIVLGTLAKPLLVHCRGFALDDDLAQVESELRVGHGNAACPAAEALEATAHVFEHVLHFRDRVLDPALVRNPYPHAVDAVLDLRLVVGHRHLSRRRIARVVAGDDPQQARGVPGASRHRSERVRGPGPRHHAVARHAPIGRLEAGHAAQRGRHAHRAAGVGPERPEDHARRDCAARSARRTAGGPLGVPRIAAVSVVLVVAGAAGRELDHVEGAEIERAGAVQTLRRGRGDAGGPFAKNLRSAGGHASGAIEQVLVRERHPVQRSEVIASGDGLVRTCRGAERLVGVDADEGVGGRLQALDALEAGAGALDARHLPGTDGGGDLDQPAVGDRVSHRRCRR